MNASLPRPPAKHHHLAEQQRLRQLIRQAGHPHAARRAAAEMKQAAQAAGCSVGQQGMRCRERGQQQQWAQCRSTSCGAGPHLRPPRSLNRRCRPKMLKAGTASAVRAREGQGRVSGRQSQSTEDAPNRCLIQPATAPLHATVQTLACHAGPARRPPTRHELQHDGIGDVAQQAAQHALHAVPRSTALQQAGALLRPIEWKSGGQQWERVPRDTWWASGRARSWYHYACSDGG